MIDTKKYGMTNEELLERFSNLSVDDYKELLAEVIRLQYWDEEMDRVIATLDEHNWASSDGDVHEIVTHLLAEIQRWRHTATLCLQAIDGGGDIRSGTIQVIEENMKIMLGEE